MELIIIFFKENMSNTFATKKNKKFSNIYYAIELLIPIDITMDKNNILIQKFIYNSK